MNRAEKQSEVEFLRDAFTKSQLALCADSRGLTVSQITTLRRELRGAGARARVVKNTLAKLAAKESFKSATEEQLSRFLGIFEGPSLVVLSDSDPIGPAKVMAKLAKTFEPLSIKGAWFEQAFLDTAGVDALSTMPGREELIAKLLNLLLAPGTQLVRLLNAPASQVVQVLEAHRSKMEESAA
ncbi:MAG: 50S ribosomal protein L10 [Deltaproteobacteria bacterium]|nr:50S ribosomal protein L10 [Deltaproteobacteria bacterium]